MMKAGGWFPQLFFLMALVLVPGCSTERSAVCPSAQRQEVNVADVFDAVETLRGVVKVSDLVKIPSFSNGNEVYLKLETQQCTGAFKLRGAYYMMSKLADARKLRGVVTCSAGNHAQGVGFAADKFGINATIFLPASAPATKIKAVRAYKKVKVELVDGTFDDAKKAAGDFQRRTNAVYIPPFDDRSIIAGQGTVGWEIMNQLPETDIIVVPIGGGGLISGISYIAKTLKPSCRVYGVQAEGAAAMLGSRKAGKIITLDNVSTLADGTAVKEPGKITFEMCRHYVDGIVTVSEEQIRDAIRRLYKECRVTAEGAGALPAAAVLNGKIPGKGKKIVCVISGGNIDQDKLNEILNGTASPAESAGKD